jgi:hypothetical protein
MDGVSGKPRNILEITLLDPHNFINISRKKRVNSNDTRKTQDMVFISLSRMPVYNSRDLTEINVMNIAKYFINLVGYFMHLVETRHTSEF